MRSLLLSVLLTSISLSCFSKEIPYAEAEKFAKAAYSIYASSIKKSSEVVIQDHMIQSSGEEVSYYFFNIEGGGFVILSAEDTYHPVLGFSENEHFDFSNVHAMEIIKGELARHEIQIFQSRNSGFKSSSNITASWSRIKNVAKNQQLPKSLNFQQVVAPLTTTKWNQDGFYNASCPADANGPNGHTYCGCLPIALAQLLKYYENPAPGNGSLTYEDPLYGTQHVDICGKEFDYANMPDVLTEPNETLTEFIYDVGKITRTQYSISYTATYVSRLENALIYNFGFDPKVRAYHGTDMTRYSTVLRDELDEERIVFLAAWSIDAQQNPAIGHTWIVDGYGYSGEGVEYMHFNWGWGGSNNGWFLDNPGAWIPHPDNPEQDVVNYYWYRYTVYNIQPSGEACSPPREDLPSSEAFENYAYLYFNSPMTDELRQFRYREKGAEQWTTSEETTLHYQYAGNLKSGTTYEYQVSRNCCGGWSSFSPVREFVTLGESDDETDPDDSSTCPSEDEGKLFVSSVSDNFAYIYTTRPNGTVNNQFRYKRTADDDWVETNISTSHFRALTDLLSGSEYEYQVRHECTDDDWSSFSASFVFTTTGMTSGDDMNDDQGSDDDCPVLSLSDFEVGYPTESGATAYLLRLTGGQEYRFRYRILGSNSAWIETTSTSFTSYNFSNLDSSTSYEIQIAQNCGSGWSEYSESKSITTL